MVGEPKVCGNMVLSFSVYGLRISGSLIGGIIVNLRFFIKLRVYRFRVSRNRISSISVCWFRNYRSLIRGINENLRF